MSKYLLFFAALLFSVNALADNDLHYNLINLSANAKTEVSNDEMSAYLQVLRSGSDASELAKAVNKSAQEALRIAKTYDAVSVQTQGYQTQPVYDDGKIQSWQVSQQLRLKSSDFSQMSELLAELQSLGNIQSMQFAISDDQLETTRQQLAEQAIEKFRAQASAIQQLIARHLDDYRTDAEAAKALLGVGLNPAPANLDPAELAAWTNAARVILNLHEAITRS